MKQTLLDFVTEKHSGQVRKYTNEPYVNHLVSVANMANKTTAGFGYEVGLCHDLLEDTDCTQKELADKLIELGYTPIATYFILGNVIELTDEYTSDKYPHLNRKARKELEALRLSDISPEAQTVKYCDLIDNTSSIVKYDKRFAFKYLDEKQVILSKMNRGDKEMYSKALDCLMQAKDQLRTI